MNGVFVVKFSAAQNLVLSYLQKLAGGLAL